LAGFPKAVTPAFVDTNIIIRYLTNDQPEKTAACYALFKRVQANQQRITTSEAVIAEAVFVLSSKKLYRLSREKIKQRLLPLIALGGLKIDYRETMMRALDLYVAHAFDFEDCLSIAHMERQQLKEIYSYDQDFDKIPHLTRKEPVGQHKAAKGSEKEQATD
jgi:predicted nucleic acid-binding protein